MVLMSLKPSWWPGAGQKPEYPSCSGPATIVRNPSVPAAYLQTRLQEQEALGDALLVDDVRTLTGIRFQVGSLVADDRAMVTFLQWVAQFPTAAPAATFR